MKRELENRLIKFSVLIIKLSESIDHSNFNNYLLNQLLRSSASAALNYGEAQNAESRKDFIHKVSIVLKELKESHINLQILSEAKIFKNSSEVSMATVECDQLVAIFYKTVLSAKKNKISNST
jgi:four helix bundle protein